MTLQNTDNFLVSRSGTSHKLSWVDLQTDIGASLTINDAFTTTGDPVTSVQTIVPYSATFGIQLPVAGINDYEIAGALRYNSVSTKVELYSGGEWVVASGTTSFTSTPPSPASIGDIWYDTDDGRSYVYYNDGDSNQWVEMNPSWNGGIPPEAITPEKMSAGGIQWDENANHSINGDVDSSVLLDIHAAATGNTGLQITSDSGSLCELRLNEATTPETLVIGQSSTENYIRSSASLPIVIDSAATLTTAIGGVTKVTTDSDGVTVSGDVEVAGTAVGVILRAPDGGRWRITVANDGSLTTTSV